MKILFLVHGLPVGGTEVMVCHLTRELIRRGCEVEIGCLDLVGELGHEMRREGVPVTLFGRRRGFDLSLPRRLARHVKNEGHDLVHAHQYTSFFYAAIATLFGPFPLLFTEHGRFYPDLPSWKRRVFNRLLGGRATAITAVSEGVKSSLVGVERFPHDRIEVLYNGIDLEPFEVAARRSKADLRDEVGLPRNRSIIGSIGRLDSIKNQCLLLCATAQLKKRDGDVLLAIAGDGPERGHLEARVRDLGLEGNVRLLGRRSDTAALMASFDVFALSSLSEGTPMTLLEAMASSTPIVSTGVGGIPEILRPGEEAILVDGSPPDYRTRDPRSGEAYLEAFTSALSALLSDVDLQNRLTRAASARVQREFSLEVVCERYVSIFESMTGIAARQPTAAVGG